MERLRFTAIALLASAYFGAIALPCASPGSVRVPYASAEEGAKVSVFCPCHAGESGSANSVGNDWQGPRSAFLRLEPFLRWDGWIEPEPTLRQQHRSPPETIPIFARAESPPELGGSGLSLR